MKSSREACAWLLVACRTDGVCVLSAGAGAIACVWEESLVDKSKGENFQAGENIVVYVQPGAAVRNGARKQLEVARQTQSSGAELLLWRLERISSRSCATSPRQFRYYKIK